MTDTAHTPKLTDAQQRVLHAFRDGKTRTAYKARAGLNTLRALQSRGFLSSKGGLGSMAFPHTSIDWTITDAGRAAISAATPKD